MLNLKDFIKQLILLAETRIPLDVYRHLKEAIKNERSNIAKVHLNNIITSLEISAKEGLPICQDTGTLQFFVKLDENISFDRVKRSIEEAVNEVNILRHNTIYTKNEKVVGNKPVIHVIGSSKCIEIDLLVKGGGSESVTYLRYFPPTEANIKKAVLEGLREAYKACPPHFIGIGVSGTAEEAILLSKIALLQGEEDEELLRLVNEVGYGSQGTGGTVTALSVKKLFGYRHPATYFVAVTFNCWALRYARGKICGGKTFLISSHLNIQGTEIEYST